MYVVRHGLYYAQAQLCNDVYKTLGAGITKENLMPIDPKPPFRAAVKPVIDQAVRAVTIPPGQQAQKLLFPVKEVEFNGVAMGVLSDGTPYLHLRGLARLCGVDSGMLSRLFGNWAEERRKPRGVKIIELLEQQKFKGDVLHLMTMGQGGETPAYTDAVCMALLEYYAFDANQGSSEIAQNNYRLLARKSFRDFIYDGCGYNPDAHIPQSWKTFHERIMLNDQMPIGYFSIFREIADLVVHMIKGGCALDSHTMPDVSVGLAWSNHWNKSGLDLLHGDRIKYDHNFPEWFPQSAANPVAAWIYPVSALGDFKMWLYRTYAAEGGGFSKYVGSKVTQGIFLPARAQALLTSVQRPEPPRIAAR